MGAISRKQADPTALYLPSPSPCLLHPGRAAAAGHVLSCWGPCTTEGSHICAEARARGGRGLHCWKGKGGRLCREKQAERRGALAAEEIDSPTCTVRPCWRHGTS